MLVIKSDGRREPFDRQKLLAGIQVAAAKRPISREMIDHMVDQIVETLQNSGRSEVSSQVIGNMVLDHLSHIDGVVFIFWDCVYLYLHDLNDLQSEIDRLMGRNQ